jgi:putative ABC transport system permease protein
MRNRERVAFAWNAMRGHGVRTGLTLLGFGIGVAAVILLTALGEGARAYVTNEFNALGTNLLIILPGKIETTGNAPIVGGSPRDLTLGDVEALRRHVPQVRRLAPLSVGAASVGYLDRRRQATIVGTTAPYKEIRRLTLSRGEFLPELDADREAAVAVLGSAIAHDLFGAESPVGRTVRVGDNRFRVIGVLESKGMSLGMNLDDFVMVPVASAMRLFDRTSLFRVMIEAGSHSGLDDLKRDVIRVMKERHEGEEDVTVLTQDAILTSFNRILGVLTLSLAGIAAVSLSVAGIGIMNVMLVSVSERTSEIGLLKAIGAPATEIQKVFLVEAILLSCAGGLVGLLAGYAGAAALGRAFPALPAEPPLWAVAAALLMSGAAGVVFGVLPARRAARLDPVLALGRR